MDGYEWKDKDERISEIKIDKVISVEIEKLAGNFMRVSRCQSIIKGTERIFELKYELSLVNKFYINYRKIKILRILRAAIVTTYYTSMTNFKSDLSQLQIMLIILRYFLIALVATKVGTLYSCNLPLPFVSSYKSVKINPAFNCPPICSSIVCEN